MSIPTDPNEAIDYIYKHGLKYAEAKATRVFMEEFRKSLKAQLMKEHADKPVSIQEREAYSDERYLTHLDGMRVAVENEEALRYGIVAAQARVEWARTESANNRTMDRVTR